MIVWERSLKFDVSCITCTGSMDTRVYLCLLSLFVSFNKFRKYTEMTDFICMI